MKRGLLAAFLVLLAAGISTGYLYVRIEYGSIGVFTEAVRRRWNYASQAGTVLRYQSFRQQRLPEIQKELQRRNLDGWLLYDYRRSNSQVYDLLPLAWDRESASKSAIPTEGQRDFFYPWVYFISASIDPFKLVHPLDAGLLEGLPGKEVHYLNREQWNQNLRNHLGAVSKVVVDETVSPWISAVLQDSGIDSVPSGELIQQFLARLSPAQLKQHQRAARRLTELIPLAFTEIQSQMESGKPITIGQLKKFLLIQMDRVALRTESFPTVTSGRHTAKPYFSPASLNNEIIREGDVLIIEIAARMDEPNSVYAKVAWTGFVGAMIPVEVEQAFASCIGARDAILQSLKNAIMRNQPITGQEVHRMVRLYLSSQGIDNPCPHPAGYSLGQVLFGSGANLDDLVHPDSRPLISDTALSIEPGVYQRDFGVRSAISIYLHEKEIEITTLPVQERIIPVLH